MVSGMARGQVASPRPFDIDTFLVLPHLIAELEKLQLRGTPGYSPVLIRGRAAFERGGEPGTIGVMRIRNDCRPTLTAFCQTAPVEAFSIRSHCACGHSYRGRLAVGMVGRSLARDRHPPA